MIGVSARIGFESDELAVAGDERPAHACLGGDALIVGAEIARERDAGEIEAELAANDVVERNVCVFEQWQWLREGPVVVGLPQALEEISRHGEAAAAALAIEEQIARQAIELRDVVTLQIGRVQQNLDNETGVPDGSYRNASRTKEMAVHLVLRSGDTAVRIEAGTPLQPHSALFSAFAVFALQQLAAMGGEA